MLPYEINSTIYNWKKKKLMWGYVWDFEFYLDFLIQKLEMFKGNKFATKYQNILNKYCWFLIWRLIWNWMFRSNFIQKIFRIFIIFHKNGLFFWIKFEWSIQLDFGLLIGYSIQLEQLRKCNLKLANCNFK